LKTTRISTTTWTFGGLVILLALFILFSLWSIASTTDFGESDFMIYWAATDLIRHGQNPYNLELIKEIQAAQIHWKPEVHTIAWNPPFLFIFLLPFAWMPFLVAKFAWLVTSILIVITAALMLIHVYMKDTAPRVKLTFTVFAVAFPAVITGLYMGQVTFLVFWGLVASLYLIKKEQWFWAGAALILTSIKPHIVVLAGIYIVVYMARQRKYQGWAGLAITSMVGFAILLLLAPNLISNLVGETSVASGRWATSTIGGLLSYWDITEAARFLFVILLPLPVYMALYPEKFSVEFSIALLTLINLPTTFYGWSYDQTILLIPIAQIFSWLSRSKYRASIIALILAALAFNYFQRVLPLNEVYYVWVPLAWWMIFGITWRDVSLSNRRLAYKAS
jgi:hypothetical protein